MQIIPPPPKKKKKEKVIKKLKYISLRVPGGNAEPDIVCNATSFLWHCCGTDSDGAPACDKPTDETFQASSPDSLSPFSISSVTSSQSTKTTTPSSPPISSTTTTPSGSSSTASSAYNTSTTASSSVTGVKSNSGLSKGGIAGIIVGAVLGVACILLLSVLLYKMRKRERQSGAPVTASQDQMKEQPGYTSDPYGSSQQQGRHEMQGRGSDHEINDGRALHELGTARAY